MIILRGERLWERGSEFITNQDQALRFTMPAGAQVVVIRRMQSIYSITSPAGRSAFRMFTADCKQCVVYEIRIIETQLYLARQFSVLSFPSNNFIT